MSTHDEDRLSRGLHDRAGDLHGAPLDLDEVLRTARGIRRRRQVLAGVAAAVVVAVAVPVGLSATGSTRADRPVAPATTSPSGTPTTTSASPSPTPDPSGAAVPLTVDGARAGAPARVDYLRGRTLVRPDGTTQELPASYDSIYPYRGGWVAIQRRAGATYVVQLDASGGVGSSVPGGDRLAVSADGLEVAWFESGKPGRMVLGTSNGHSDGDTSVPVTGRYATPVGFLAPGSVAYQVDGENPTSWVTDFGSSTQRLAGVLRVTATNQERALVGVQTSYDSGTGRSCWRAGTNRGGDQEGTSCEWTIRSFSVDGAHWVGFPSGTDGLGATGVGILDAGTGDVVAAFERRGTGDAFVNEAVWEDESHVLATLHEGGEWHLVRLGADGTVETVDDLPGAAEDCPFHFAALP